MSKIFFTSDLHFYHKNIIKYEHRPFSSVEEMNKTLIKNWNNTVSNEDSVYILGDFCFGNYEEAYQIAKQLNGKKYMILGNHDKCIKVMPTPMKQEIFEWVKDYHMLKHEGMKLVLFHFPVQVWDCQHYGSIHLYGHIHSNSHELIAKIPNSYNVGIDVNNYKPIEFNEILSKL